MHRLLRLAISTKTVGKHSHHQTTCRYITDTPSPSMAGSLRLDVTLDELVVATECIGTYAATNAHPNVTFSLAIAPTPSGPRAFRLHLNSNRA